MGDRDQQATAFGRLMELQGRRNDWLAERVGVSRMSVWRWRCGIRAIPEENKELIARALEVPVRSLEDTPLRGRVSAPGATGADNPPQGPGDERRAA